MCSLCSRTIAAFATTAVIAAYSVAIKPTFAAAIAAVQELMAMLEEQSNLYDWFGRTASFLEWTVTYAGGYSNP